MFIICQLKLIWTISRFFVISNARDILFSPWLNFNASIFHTDRCHFVWNMDCGNFIVVSLFGKKICFRKKTRTNSLILFKWDSYFGSSCHFNVDISIFPLRQPDYVYVGPEYLFSCSTPKHDFPNQGSVIFQNRKLLISFPNNLNLHGLNAF